MHCYLYKFSKWHNFYALTQLWWVGEQQVNVIIGLIYVCMLVYVRVSSVGYVTIDSRNRDQTRCGHTNSSHSFRSWLVLMVSFSTLIRYKFCGVTWPWSFLFSASAIPAAPSKMACFRYVSVNCEESGMKKFVRAIEITWGRYYEYDPSNNTKISPHNFTSSLLWRSKTLQNVKKIIFPLSNDV